MENVPDLKVVIGLNRSANAINRRANAVFRRHGLTPMQFAVLEALYHKGDLKVGQLIEKVLTTGGNMTVVINNLAREHMVEKRTDPADSRSYIISITERGCIKIEDIFPEYLQDLKEVLGIFSGEDKLALINLFKKLCE